MLYLLSGDLSGAGGHGDEFVEGVASRVSEFHPVSPLASAAALGLANVGADDGVAFVIGDNPSQDAIEFLGRAAGAGAVILPIALDPEHRRPPDIVDAVQSFDVVDVLRRGDHPQGRLDVAARVFARAALARLAPTCFRSRLRIFLTYRREDGEGLTAELDKALSARHDHVFRDLVDIQVGEEAQDVIDECLHRADVVIFIDTPHAGESWWVAHELASALGSGIPVVWSRVGSLDGRAPLTVTPGESPQVEIPDIDGLTLAEYAENILDAALDQVQEAIRASTSAFALVRRWAGEHGGDIVVLDQRQLIYAITIPDERATIYPRRVRRDIVQLFGRSPNDEDVNELQQWLGTNGYLGHPVQCRAFDAAILVRPATGSAAHIEDWGVVDSGDQYVLALSGARSPAELKSQPTLLLLGAFPADPRTHPSVIAAISALSRSWLARGGNLVFGGHPTFAPLIAEAARLVLAPDSRERVIVYRSGFFAESGFNFDGHKAISVRQIPAGVDLPESLTALREAMIQAGAVDIAVIVGGRTAEGGAHDPGVEDELSRARAAGIPVVALASPGGQAAVIAEREKQASPAWAGLANGFSDELNGRIADDDDYAALADLLWDRFATRPA